MRHIFNNIDDVDRSAIVWMPAHTATKDIGNVYISNGQPLTSIDRYSNAIADKHAKVAAARYAAHEDVVKTLEQYYDDVVEALKWLGLASWTATHAEIAGVPAVRDSDASRLKADVSKRARHAGVETSTAKKETAGGKVTSAQRFMQWQQKCRNATELSEDGLRHKSHVYMLTGGLYWCSECGAYAATRNRGLAKPCPGKVPLDAVGAGRSS